MIPEGVCLKECVSFLYDTSLERKDHFSEHDGKNSENYDEYGVGTATPSRLEEIEELRKERQ